MKLKPIVFSAGKQAINILFEGSFDPGDVNTIQDPGNYLLLDEDLKPVALAPAPAVSFDQGTRVVTIALANLISGAVRVRLSKTLTGVANNPFTIVSPTTASDIQTVSVVNPVSVQVGPSALVDDARAALRNQRDAFSYPMLTEEIGGGARPSGSNRNRNGGGGELTTLVSRALGDVLGWKARTDDPAAFEGALTASFEVEEVDGVTNWTWTPRTYAVQSDLSGGISGAQASLYKRAQEALQQSLPLLDGLYPLDPKADAENIAALKAVVRTQLTQLVSELATAGGPSEARVNSYFGLLLTRDGKFQGGNGALDTSEPDDLGGTLGELRDQLGLSTTQRFVNTIEDEQDLTNFRILADYVTSLAQTWLNNRHFFGFGKGPRFLGTQLVPLSRQLTVVSTSVDELRFALDSVFIGAAERQTLALDLGDDSDGMYAEDFLQWIQNFVDDEAPIYVQQGGKFGIGNSVLPIARRLLGLATHLRNQRGLPEGFSTSRVQIAVDSLVKELGQLVDLGAPVGTDFPSPIAASMLLVIPRTLDVDIALATTEHRITLLNAGTVDVAVAATIVQGADKFEFAFRNGKPDSKLKLTVKAGSSREVVVTERDGIVLSTTDTGAIDFLYGRADGTGKSRRTSVNIDVVNSHPFE